MRATAHVHSADDGASASGASVSHIFTTTGAHSATLVVTDSSGRTGSVRLPVTVLTPPSASGRGGSGTGHQDPAPDPTPDPRGRRLLTPTARRTTT